MADNIQAVGIEFDARDFERALARAMRRLDQLEDAFDDNVRAARRQQDAFDGLGTKVLQLASAYGAFRAAQGAARFLFDTNVEFEQLEARLVSITGSVEDASSAFDLITRFAAATPFQIQNLTAAFTQLSAVGLQPTQDTLRDLGNFAAAMGRDITEFVNAVTRAATGETEALKSFGVIARSEGDRLRVTFRGVTHEVQRDFAPVVALFQQLGRENFGDAMERQMTTLAGALSNLEDTASLLAKEIGEAGLNGEITNLVRTLEGAIAESDAFAEVLGQALATGVRGATEALEAFVRHIELIATGLQLITGALIGRGLVSLAMRLRQAALAAEGLATVMAFAGGWPGIIAAVGGALAFTLLPRLTDAKEEASELAQALDDLGEVKFKDAIAERFEGVTNEQLQGFIRDLEAQNAQLNEALGRGGVRGDAFGRIRLNTALIDAARAEIERRMTLPEMVFTITGDGDAGAQDSLDRLLAQLEEQRIALEQGEEAAFRFRLAQQGITGEAQDEVVALFQAVQALETRQKAAEDAERTEERRQEAIRRTLESLDAEYDALTLTREALVRKELEAQGASEAEIQRAEERIAAIEAEEARRRELEEREREAQARLEAEMEQFQSDADRMAEAFGDAFVDVVAGTENVAEAFERMVDSILRDLARIAIREALTEPLGKALGGLLGGFFGAIFGGGAGAAAGSAVGDAVFGGFAADGANFHAGETFIVGERGPEAVQFNRSGQIRPLEVVSAPPVVPAPVVKVEPRFEFDLSALPAPTNPLAAARDADWLRFLAESNRELAAAGA